jgi:formimidoylglutamase
MTDPDFSLTDLQANTDPRDPRARSLLVPSSAAGTGLRDRRVMLGLPYDGGIPSRPGARFGPGALRAALPTLGTFDGSRELSATEPMIDLGDLSLPPMDAAETHRRVREASRRLWLAGACPVFVGGDHGLTGSVIAGLADARPETKLALISVDAHLDVREYEGPASISSGTPFRRALETGVLEGARTAMIGLRPFANSRYYVDWARERGVVLLPIDDVWDSGAPAVAREALDAVLEGADALYLSVDLDAADASVAPGVSAAGAGGLSAREMIELVRALASEPRLIGADLMELSPPYDPDDRTARLAARLLLEILRTSPPLES